MARRQVLQTEFPSRLEGSRRSHVDVNATASSTCSSSPARGVPQVRLRRNNTKTDCSNGAHSLAPFDAIQGGDGRRRHHGRIGRQIIVGSGPGMESQIKCSRSTRADEIRRHPTCSPRLTPYPGSESVLTLATRNGRIGPGRESTSRAPARGRATREDVPMGLYTPTARAQQRTTPQQHRASRVIAMTAQFMEEGEDYKDGVALSRRLAGARGGAKSIVTSELAGDARCGLVERIAAGRSAGIYATRPHRRRSLRPDFVLRSVPRGAGV